MTDSAPPGAAEQLELLQRIRAAAELLESVDANRGLLAHVPEEDRRRFLHATRQVAEPDHHARRRLVKAARRRRKAELIEQAEDVFHGTGIRELRRKPVFTTPNYYLSEGAGGRAQGAEEGAEEWAEERTAEGVEERAEEEAEEGAEEQASLSCALPPAPCALSERRLPESRHCYVCKRHYHDVHHFYDQLCPECAELNFRKRTETADLTGRVALLTGGRVKIGYQAGLKLLRAGARLIVTTRFPRDAAARYAAEPDFAVWGDRVEIFGLDLRHIPSVEAFCREMLATRDRLDFIINNACQTVRRPPAFYEHMMEGETAALHTMSATHRRLLGHFAGKRGYDLLGDGGQAILPVDSDLPHAPTLSQVPLLPEDHETGAHLFPRGALDQDLQQIDLRGRNSWRLLLDEVATVEFLEVQLINATAPFILNARLKALMLKTPGRDKHIVNVSAVEGQFYRNQKTTRHPHTNMAKAALNMMTRTSAADYHRDGIHMNSVDTGWVTDEDPAEIAARKVTEQRFHPPLDIIDGAARITDPIITGINTGEHVWGQFLKDYRVTDW